MAYLLEKSNLHIQTEINLIQVLTSQSIYQVVQYHSSGDRTDSTLQRENAVLRRAVADLEARVIAQRDTLEAREVSFSIFFNFYNFYFN